VDPNAVVHGPGQTNCKSTGNICYYTPADLATAYSLSFVANANGGAGITIGIVDAYSNTQAEADLATFSTQFGLPACSVASGCLKFVNQTGGSTPPGCSDTAANCAGWWGEQDLDIEWAHAVAPNAHILVVTTNSNSNADLATGLATAVSMSNVVSNSYGGPEGVGEGLSSFDTVMSTSTVPSLFSSGDQKASEPTDYPCASSRAVCVGGTNLLTTATSFRNVESAWGEGAQGGAGGACSTQILQPAFQSGFAGICGAFRGTPDVALIADPFTGGVTYLGANATQGAQGFYVAGGTSLASPVFAGEIALVDAARVFNGKAKIGANLNALLYQAAAAPFYHYRMYDVTTGTNNFFSAGAGWDRASGLGVPLLPSLTAYLLSLP
jgi:subtilase family serine protease